jgi:hypothetical protein
MRDTLPRRTASRSDQTQDVGSATIVRKKVGARRSAPKDAWSPAAERPILESRTLGPGGPFHVADWSRDPPGPRLKSVAPRGDAVALEDDAEVRVERRCSDVDRADASLGDARWTLRPPGSRPAANNTRLPFAVPFH